MELESTSQQVADLHLFLYERPLHPELFRHFADYRLEQGRYVADIWIVGLSHVVTVTSGSKTVVEMVAPDNDLLPTRGLLTRFRLKGERDIEKKCPNGWVYMVSSQVEPMDEHLFKSVHNDLRRQAAKRGWFHQFDQFADGELVPFTHIEHEARDAELHVYAYHSFPAERTIVKTQSIFELLG
ncbi:MAG: hypothetical protein CHACPFDD_00147 [Phycisphaerae bacterium]|nr:hypothetical protein [Phycisphaerae bacterium]